MSARLGLVASWLALAARRAASPRTRSLGQGRTPSAARLLGLTLRPPKETVLDMAKAMLEHAVVKPKLRGSATAGAGSDVCE